jgi:hypothetical protein
MLVDYFEYAQVQVQLRTTSSRIPFRRNANTYRQPVEMGVHSTTAVDHTVKSFDRIQQLSSCVQVAPFLQYVHFFFDISFSSISAVLAR